jgi:disulfide oxidoreductase YuzD
MNNNIVVDVDDSSLNFKSLLVQDSGEDLRVRNLFHVNDIMGGTYWLLDEENNIKFKLNVNQVKVLKIAMAMINPKEKIDPNKPPIAYTFTIDKLLEIMGYSNDRLKYIDLPDFLDSLMASDNFKYRDEKGTLYLMHIFDSVIYKQDKKEVTFRFSWSMLEKFLTIEDKKDGTYQSYMIGNIMGFESLYSISLYELFKVKLKGQKNKNFDIDLLDLKTALDLYSVKVENNEEIKEKYPRYYDFKKNVLDKSINEINNTDKIDLKVSYTERKRGKTVVSIVFQLENVKYTNKNNEEKIIESSIESVCEDESIKELVIDVDDKIIIETNNEQNIDIVKTIKSLIGDDLISRYGKDLSDKSCHTIYKSANGNIEIIKEKIELAKTQKIKKGIGAWLNSAIINNYGGNNKTQKQLSLFSDYDNQRSLDYVDKIEEMMLNKETDIDYEALRGTKFEYLIPKNA